MYSCGPSQRGCLSLLASRGKFKLLHSLFLRNEISKALPNGTGALTRNKRGRVTNHTSKILSRYHLLTYSPLCLGSCHLNWMRPVFNSLNTSLTSASEWISKKLKIIQISITRPRTYNKSSSICFSPKHINHNLSSTSQWTPMQGCLWSTTTARTRSCITTGVIPRPRHIINFKMKK